MRILVAGVGNIFYGDDGFGPAVARRLLREGPPPGTRVVDYGIRGLHFAYELLEPLDRLVIVDAMQRSEEPGTLYVVEPDLDALFERQAPDAHGMHLPAVFAQVRALGAVMPPTVIVGCEPLDVDEGMGLSAPVARSVDAAVSWVREIVGRERRGAVESHARREAERWG